MKIRKHIFSQQFFSVNSLILVGSPDIKPLVCQEGLFVQTPVIEEPVEQGAVFREQMPFIVFQMKKIISYDILNAAMFK